MVLRSIVVFSLLHLGPIVNGAARSAARQNFAYPRRFIVVLLRRTSLYASQNDFFAPRSALFWRAAPFVIHVASQGGVKDGPFLLAHSHRKLKILQRVSRLS